MTITAAHSAPVPTADQPEQGGILVAGVHLSDVLYWVEIDEHVFRSTEYDVLAADKDFAGAIAKFIANSEDYAQFIADLSKQDDASREEADVALTLMQRFTEAYREQRDAAQKDARRVIRLPRKRPGHHAPDGYRRSLHRKLSQHSPA